MAYNSSFSGLMWSLPNSIVIVSAFLFALLGQIVLRLVASKEA
jgi:hypothetical protein